MPERPPNILVFMTDQEQAQVVHPDHPCQTPNATRLAESGVLFTRANCPTAHCCPSRATFMTGLAPSRHGIYNNVSNPMAIHRALNDGVGMFSQALRAAGYHLAYAGKWHVSDAENPGDRGWDEIMVTAGKGSYMDRSIEDWRRRATEPQETGPRPRGVIRRPGWGDYRLYGTRPDSGDTGYEDVRDCATVSAGIRALGDLAKQDAPWFLFIGPNGPHDPFIIPERFASIYDPREIDLPPSFADDLEDKPRVYQRMRRQYWGQLSKDEVRESIQHYWGYCTMMDCMLGEVLDALDATGQADDTLVFFMSDHGDYVGAHGLYLKGVPAFKEAYRIACIARWPSGIAHPGREVDEFVTLADFRPTFEEVAGLTPADDLTGRSLAPFLRGETPADWPDAFHSQFNGVELYYTQRVVETKTHKYVYNGFDFDELYDLVDDPHEMVNRWNDPAIEDVKHELVRKMWRYAGQERDIIFNPYPTTALAPWGPADALRE